MNDANDGRDDFSCCIFSDLYNYLYAQNLNPSMKFMDYDQAIL